MSFQLFPLFSADYNDGIVGSCPKDAKWTPWHSRDLPSGTGDWEVRSLYKPKGTCADDKIAPLAIQAKLVSTNQPYQYGNDVVTINPSIGFICRNKDQKDRRCNNYKVRYCCKKEGMRSVLQYDDTNYPAFSPILGTTYSAHYSVRYLDHRSHDERSA